MSITLRRSWLLMLGVAFALRVLIAWGLQIQLDQHLHRNFLIPGDADGYWELAGKLLHGEPYAIFDPPRFVLRMPGFPLLIAAARWICLDNFLGVRILLALVGTFGCDLVFRLGSRLCNERIGLIAGWLTAISPTLAGFSVLILSETPFAVAMVGSLLAIEKWSRPRGISKDLSNTACPTFSGAAWAGIWMGVANLLRPSWLLFAPLCILYQTIQAMRNSELPRWSGLRMIGQGTIFVGTLLFVLAPWTIRNYRVTGHIIPTTLWMGPSLYDGLNPRATGDSDMTFIETDGVYQRMSEYDADQYYRKKAWNFVRENPGSTLELAVRKLVRYFSPWPNAAQFQNWGLKLLVTGFFLPMLCFAAIGCSYLKRFTRPGQNCAWVLLLTAGPMVYFALLHMIFVGSIRYRLPTEYAFLTLTAIGIEHLWQKWRHRRQHSS